jgi:hypothetical protein
MPVGGVADVSGFAQLGRMFAGNADRALIPLAVTDVLSRAAMVA